MANGPVYVRWLLAGALMVGAANGFAEESDGVCDPNAAEAANDPDCANPNQGPVCDYADTCGVAESCGSADTCETATTCLYADTCGDAETCDTAAYSDTAGHAATCDSATFAETCGTANTADYALTVGECTTGIFGLNGATSPNCGDLRYDGSLGIATTPTATLDVAGTVALRGDATSTGLHVVAGGLVGVGTSTPQAELDVSGTIVATSFVTGGAPSQRVKTVLPATDCRVVAAASTCTNCGDFTSDGRALADELVCGVTLPAGAVVDRVECAGWGTAQMTVELRDFSQGVVQSWTDTGDLGAAVELAIGAVVEGGESLSLHFTTAHQYYVQLNGCQIHYGGL